MEPGLVPLKNSEPAETHTYTHTQPCSTVKCGPANILDSDLSGEQLFLLWARWGARKELEAVLVCEECMVAISFRPAFI